MTVISYQLSVISYQLSVISFQFSENTAGMRPWNVFNDGAVLKTGIIGRQTEN
jgi:hypothetical protein